MYWSLQKAYCYAFFANGLDKNTTAAATAAVVFTRLYPKNSYETAFAYD